MLTSDWDGVIVTAVKNQNKIDLLGEAPIQTQATAQKCRETPMGRTGIVDYKAFHKVAKSEGFLRCIVLKLNE